MSRGVPQWINKCAEIIKVFYDDPLTDLFKNPLTDPKFLEDYLQIVSRPMDLTTLKNNLMSQKYENEDQFLADFNLIFENAKKYNCNWPLMVGICNHLQKKLNKEVRNRLHSPQVSSRLVYLYTKYLEILEQKPEGIPSTLQLPEVSTLTDSFIEPTMAILAERLNQISNENTYEEIRDILGLERNTEEKNIELSKIPSDKIKKLWEYTKTHSYTK